MSGPVVFNPANFIAAFPEFAEIAPSMLQNYFDMADAFFKNDASNPAAGDIDRMTRLSYLVTAHVAWLMSPRDATGNLVAGGSINPLVGRISSASEGSVSVSVDLPGGESGPTEAFFSQTKYGFMFWAATAQYRTARYAAQPTFVPSTRPHFYRRGPGGYY